MSRVYFGKLPRDTRESDIEDMCKKFGRIRDLRLLQGFGFVEFDDARDANDAVKDLDGRRFLGERIIVEIARGGRDKERRERRRSPIRVNRRGEHRIVIRGLPPRTSWQDLKDTFRKAGEVQYTNMERSGDGIVEFVHRDGLEKALEIFKDYEMDGSRLTVEEDLSNDDRRREPRRRSISPRRRSSYRSPRRDRDDRRRRDSLQGSPDRRDGRNSPERRNSRDEDRKVTRRDSNGSRGGMGDRSRSRSPFRRSPHRSPDMNSPRRSNHSASPDARR